MSRLKDIGGRRFGRWTAIKKVSSRGEKNSVWLCRCDCGRENEIILINLTSGKSKSCGCYRDVILKDRVGAKNPNFKHGLTSTKMYKRASKFKSKCQRREQKALRISNKLVIEIMKIWGNSCVYCGSSNECTDHVLPISKGGTTTIENLVPCCNQCNLRKSNKILGSEWLPKLQDGESFYGKYIRVS